LIARSVLHFTKPSPLLSLTGAEPVYHDTSQYQIHGDGISHSLHEQAGSQGASNKMQGRSHSLVFVFLLLASNAQAVQHWTCVGKDGTKAIQDHPCDDPNVTFNGVMASPIPKPNDTRPEWCDAHRSWLERAQNQKVVATDPSGLAALDITIGNEQKWLNIHHCP
jgi:hypothetical protein